MLFRADFCSYNQSDVPPQIRTAIYEGDTADEIANNTMKAHPASSGREWVRNPFFDKTYSDAVMKQTCGYKPEQYSSWVLIDKAVFEPPTDAICDGDTKSQSQLLQCYRSERIFATLDVINLQLGTWWLT